MDALVAHRARAQPDGYREERYDFEAAADAPQLAPETGTLQGRRLPLVDRVEISVIEESQPRWLAFLQGELDILDPVPIDLVRVAAPNGRLAPFLEKRRVKAVFTPMSDVTLSYFNMEHPLVGGYAPEKVALRRAIALGLRRPAVHPQHLQRLRRAGAVAVHLRAPGATTRPTARRCRSTTRRRARALLDTYGYVDRNGDGWRETPRGPAVDARNRVNEHAA